MPQNTLRMLGVMQIYLMLSCCPCEGHIAGIVDAPNCCCTLAIPLAIFDQVSTCGHGLIRCKILCLPLIGLFDAIGANLA